MAAGDTLLTFTALQGEPPDDDSAALIRTLVASTDEPDDLVPAWAFDDTNNEYIEFSSIMPRHYGGNGLDVTLIWQSPQNTNAARWEVAFKSITDDADNLDTKAYAAANSGNFTSPSVVGEVDHALITFADGADMDSIAAGEYFRMRVNADAADAGHTITGDARLIAIEVRESP